MSELVTPHGGTLVDRSGPAEQAGALAARLAGLPALTLNGREIADLELIATGAASPLRGFPGSADYRSVCERLRLADGTVWPVPFTLAAADASIEPGREYALQDGHGRAWGVIEVSETFTRDPREEAPPRPDVVVRSDRETVDESLGRILTTLVSKGLLTPREAGVTIASAGVR